MYSEKYLSLPSGTKSHILTHVLLESRALDCSAVPSLFSYPTLPLPVTILVSASRLCQITKVGKAFEGSVSLSPPIKTFTPKIMSIFLFKKGFVCFL
jgi:hypothetical protein